MRDPSSPPMVIYPNTYGNIHTEKYFLNLANLNQILDCNYTFPNDFRFWINRRSVYTIQIWFGLERLKCNLCICIEGFQWGHEWGPRDTEKRNSLKQLSAWSYIFFRDGIFFFFYGIHFFLDRILFLWRD